MEKKVILPKRFFLEDDGMLIGDEDVFKNIEKVVDNYKDLIKHYKWLRERYNGNSHEIHNRTLKSGANNKVPVHHEKKIIDMSTGYNTGRAITYSFPALKDDEGKGNKVNPFENKVSTMEETSMTSLLWKGAMIYGHTYMIVFEKEDEAGEKYLAGVERTPETMILLHDDDIEETPYLAILLNGIYDIDGKKDGYKYQIYTDKEFRNFNEKGEVEKLLDENGQEIAQDLPYGELPIIEWKSNEERMSVIELTAGLIDGYNQTLNDKLNTSEYFSEPILIISDANMMQIENQMEQVNQQYDLRKEVYSRKRSQIERDENLTEEEKTQKIELLNAPLSPELEIDLTDIKTFYTKSTTDQKSATFKFLEKPNDDATQENTLDRLKEEIHSISGIPDMSAKGFGGQSGRAIEFAMLSLNYTSQVQQSCFKVAFKKKLRILAEIIGEENSEFLNDVSIKFNEYVPENLKELSEVLAILNNVYTKEMLYEIGNTIIDENKATQSWRKSQEELSTEAGAYFNGEGEEVNANDREEAYAYGKAKGEDNRAKSKKDVFD